MTTFVLVHGSYQGGWIWQLVAQRLEQAGHHAYRPTLDGSAERRRNVAAGLTLEQHGAELADLLFGVHCPQKRISGERPHDCTAPIPNSAPDITRCCRIHRQSPTTSSRDRLGGI